MKFLLPGHSNQSLILKYPVVQQAFFSKKVRLLSGISKIEKEKSSQIYRIKKILKACSLPLAEYKKTKSFNGKDNFREDKITSEESQFVGENINKETVKEINNLYSIHFPGK